MEEVKEMEEKLQANVETVKGVKLYYSELGNVRVLLKAPILLRHKTEEPFLEFPEGLEVSFYDDKQRISSSLTAQYGIRYEKTKLTTVRDSVIWKNNVEQKKIESEEMIWDEQQQRVLSEKFVKITTETGVVFGKNGFEANQDFSEFRLKAVEGKVNAKEMLE